ncbi:hypothetical protein BKA63DRAFT_506886 [Paraphoma chrysanthemicola]|nr:hypothetical protein BKA63DRAFT_506886 [Paraphoma chrysanthemicola]
MLLHLRCHASTSSMLCALRTIALSLQSSNTMDGSCDQVISNLSLVPDQSIDQTTNPSHSSSLLVFSSGCLRI